MSIENNKDMLYQWRRRAAIEKEWERLKRDPSRQPVPYRDPYNDSWPAVRESDWEVEEEKRPAPKKRKRKPTPKKPPKPKVEPSRITPGVPIRDLIFDDEPEKK